MNLTHIDENGKANMVDISKKNITDRLARASGVIKMKSEVIDAVVNNTVKKGDVLSTARIAGIMAIKKTSDLIPLCHSLLISKADIDFIIDRENSLIKCESLVKLQGKTGAEMEALCGVCTALLTVYDMCKAMDKTMVISDIRLEEKDGGKSGHFNRKEEENED